MCLSVVLAILVAGLWPFDFFPENIASWMPDSNGIQFNGRGMIISSDPWLKGRKPLFPNKSISLVLWLRPLVETRSLPHILTLYDGQTPDVFMIGQWRSHVVIRSRTDHPALAKRGQSYQEMDIENGLLRNREVFIALTSGPGGSTLYLNGRQVDFYPQHRLLAGAGSGNVRLILGNAATGQSGWTGSLLGLAIFDQVLTADQVSRNSRSLLPNDPSLMHGDAVPIGLYYFSERRGAIIHNRMDTSDALIIPETFVPIKRRILEPPWQDFHRGTPFLWDTAINISGFLPLGFFLTLFLRKTRQMGKGRLYVLIALSGFGLSLAIELIQVYLPTRYSQISDVLCNSAGTILGLVIFDVYERLDRRRPG